MALTPANMAEALWIGDAGGQNHYNVGIGQGTSGGQNHEDFSQALIEAGYTDPDKFFLNSDNNPVFRINAGAGRTSTNTAHPRSELREYLQDGTTKAAWDARSGVHYMRARSRIIDVTANRPWVCFFQIHGTEGLSPEPSDLVRVQVEGSTGQTTNLSIICRRSPPSGGAEIVTTLATGYDVNDWVSWEIRFDAGRLRIILDGATVLDVASGMAQAGCYFKMGCYLQDNVEKGATATDWAAVEVERGSFQTWHTGYPNPTIPVFTGPDDGLGSGTDTQAPTVPDDLAVIRGNTTATLVWDAATDNVAVADYRVRRTSGSSGTAVANLGKITDGPATSASSAAKTIVCAYTATQAGTLVAGNARVWTDTGTAAGVALVVYADTAGVPTTRLAVSDTLTVSNTAEAEIYFTFSGGNQIAIVAGTTYWIGIAWPDPGTNNINWSRNATTGATQQATSNAPSPFGTPSTVLSGPIDAYLDVQYATGGTSIVATVTTTSYTDTGLTNGVVYSYTVTARDAAGNESAQSDAVTVTPGAPDTTAPTVPTGLVGTAGDRRATLTWTASTDADTGVRNYRIFRDGVSIAYTENTGYVDTERTNGTAYSYRVAAVDNSLNESTWSDAVSVTPTAATVAGVAFLDRELGADAALGVEIAFGADLGGDPADWVWTDVTADVRQDPGISTSLGRNDEASTSNPAELTLALTNKDGGYSLGGRSANYPYIRRNTPVRVRIDPADGGGGRVVFHGGATGWTPGWDSLTGRIPVVTLSASGTLRRLAQGDAPVQSSFRRAITANSSIVAYWPMEEGTAATYAPAVRGGRDMRFTADFPGAETEWASDSSFFCSDKLPRIKTGQLTAFPAPYTDTGTVQVRFLMLMPDSPTAVPAGAYLFSVFTTGSVARWDVIYRGSFIEIAARLTSGATVYSATFDYDFTGRDYEPARVGLVLQQNGGNIDWTFDWTPARPRSGGFYNPGTITGQTAGAVSWVQFGANQQLGDTVIGHLTVGNGPYVRASTTTNGSQFEDNLGLSAFQGEAAIGPAVALENAPAALTSRLERLCVENGIPLTVYPSTLTGDALNADRAIHYRFDGMGPQLVAPLLTLLREAEAADGGQLWDGRAHGLAYSSRRRREAGAVKLTIDAAAGELAGDFAPTDDDQRTRNRVAVKRAVGVTSEYEDTDGPLGTGEIGTYDEQVTVNLHRDQDTAQHAQWRVAAGTVVGYRYPSVTVDLRVAPHLAPAILDLVPGERVDVTGLDDTLEQFTAPSVSLVVEGIAHEITSRSWRCTLRCSPFEPLAVGRVAAESGDTSDMVMRLDTDGSEVTTNVPAGATALVVQAVGSAAVWTTDADDYPLWLEVGGLPVRATACSGASSPQTFTVDPLPVARAAGDLVALWQPRRLGMGESTR